MMVTNTAMLENDTPDMPDSERVKPSHAILSSASSNLGRNFPGNWRWQIRRPPHTGNRWCLGRIHGLICTCRVEKRLNQYPWMRISRTRGFGINRIPVSPVVVTIGTLRRRQLALVGTRGVQHDWLVQPRDTTPRHLHILHVHHFHKRGHSDSRVW